MRSAPVSYGTEAYYEKIYLLKHEKFTMRYYFYLWLL